MLNLSEMPQHKNDYLVLSLDFDGCLDTEESQEKLIQFIIQHCKQNPQYQSIAIAIGSLRQSVFTDFHNAARYYEERGYNYISCSQLLDAFIKKLIPRLKAEFKNAAPDIKRISMLNADLFNRLPIGTTLNYMDSDKYHEFMHPQEIRSIQLIDDFGNSISSYSQKAFETWYNDLKLTHDEASLARYLNLWGLEPEDLEEYAEWRQSLPSYDITVTNNDGKDVTLLEVDAFQYYTQGNSIHYDDCSKHTQLYNLYHFGYDKIKRPFDLLHFDDVASILSDFEQYTFSHPSFLPFNCTFQGVDWNSHPSYSFPLILTRPIIYGQGSPNKNYAEDTRQIALKLSTHYFSYETLKEELSQLCQAHSEPVSVPPPVRSDLDTFSGKSVPFQGLLKPTPTKGAATINWEAEGLGLQIQPGF